MGLSRSVHTHHASKKMSLPKQYSGPAAQQEAAVDIQRLIRGKQARRTLALKEILIKKGVPRTEVKKCKDRQNLNALAKKHGIDPDEELGDEEGVQATSCACCIS